MNKACPKQRKIQVNLVIHRLYILMQRFGLLFSDRDQCVFTESTVSYASALWALVFGVLGGYLSGLLLTSKQAVALLLCGALYLSIRLVTISVSFDPAGTAFGCSVIVLVLAVLYTLHVMFAEHDLILFYTIIIGTLSPVTYLYAQIVFVEDKRKHILQLLRRFSSCSTASVQDSVHSLSGFVLWIVDILLWRAKFSLLPSDSLTDKDTKSFSLRNSTLKTVKVCIYDSRDFCCWIPHGGIGGPGVVFISSGKTGEIPCNTCAVTLKVFIPGMIDKEIGCAPGARAGDLWEIRDVCMRIRRIHKDSEDHDNYSPALLIKPEGLDTGARRIKRNPSSFHISSSGSSPSLTPVSPLLAPSGEYTKSNEQSVGITIKNDSVLPVQVKFYRDGARSFLRPLDVEGSQIPIPSGEVRIFENLTENVCLRVEFFSGECDYCSACHGDYLQLTDGLID